MSGAGSRDLLVRSRTALLDAIDALSEHQVAIVVIGAQAVYLRVEGVSVALAESTKDSDVAVDSRVLEDEPLLEQAMTAAGFRLDPISNQPGAWLSPDGLPVDLMIPEALAGSGGKAARGARIPPHGRRAARRARGLEAAVVDNDALDVVALDPSDTRRRRVRVAGPSALLVAKLHKIDERSANPKRLVDKDAHDVYRIFRGTETKELARRMVVLLDDELSRDVTLEAVEQLERLFAAGPEALGAVMAGRAEEGVGDPANVSVSVALLAEDLLGELRPGLPGPTTDSDVA